MTNTKEHPIRAARTQRELTLKQLGDLSGVDFAAISKIERRKQNPRVETLIALGRALGVEWWKLAEDQEQTT
jgi:transcriptional regulator with XRE-family HTH domain